MRDRLSHLQALSEWEEHLQQQGQEGVNVGHDGQQGVNVGHDGQQGVNMEYGGQERVNQGFEMDEEEYGERTGGDGDSREGYGDRAGEYGTSPGWKEGTGPAFGGSGVAYGGSPGWKEGSGRAFEVLAGHQGERAVDCGESVAGTMTTVDLEDEDEEVVWRREVVWDNAEDVEEVLQEAQEVRREIQLLKLDVKRLREQNGRLLSEPTRTTAVKHDANAIGQNIKTRGEEVLGRLRRMDEHTREREAELGVNTAAARIGRTQYACLSNAFRDAMNDYQQAEMSHRQACSNQIRRQMEIVGRDMTSEQLDDAMENGQWNVFADNLLAEGKTARTALNQIERRHQELLDLERRIKSVHEVFLDVAMLVEEQGAMMDSILTHVQKTDAHLEEAVVRLTKAKKHDKANPFKKMFCGCFPCYK